jgi:hypothetical protein
LLVVIGPVVWMSKMPLTVMSTWPLLLIAHEPVWVALPCRLTVWPSSVPPLMFHCAGVTESKAMSVEPKPLSVPALMSSREASAKSSVPALSMMPPLSCTRASLPMVEAPLSFSPPPAGTARMQVLVLLGQVV